MVLLFALTLAQQAWPPTLFTCQVAYVHDGDTFRCTDGTRIRLSAIDAPEMPGACRPGRHCAPGDPYQAQRALASMIDRRMVECERNGTSYNRVVAWCSIGGRDLSCAMLRNGNAIRLPRFDPHERLNRC
jgi:endonuclease YncB( thermonuclease family)